MNIYALSSGRGPSGIAIVRVSGKDTLKVCKNLTKLKEINEGIDIYQNLDWINKIPLKTDEDYEDYNYEAKKKDDDGNEIEELSWDAKIKTNQSLAKNLKGYLLLTHGNIDNNVHPTNSMRVADELIKAGKRFDMMIFPGKRHGYGSFRSYYEKMMWYYFSEHLLGDYRNNVDINLPDSGN